MKKIKVKKMNKTLKIKLIKSPYGRIPKHKRILDAMGLRKTNKIVYVPDNPMMWGMIKKIPHLVTVERIEEENA